MKHIVIAIGMLFATACGATHVKVEPVRLEPIHVTVDVNVHPAPTSTATPDVSAP